MLALDWALLLLPVHRSPAYNIDCNGFFVVVIFGFIDNISSKSGIRKSMCCSSLTSCTSTTGIAHYVIFPLQINIRQVFCFSVRK